MKIEKLVQVVSDLRGQGKGRGPGVLQRHCGGAAGPGPSGKPDTPLAEQAGLCGCRPGQAHDALPSCLRNTTRQLPRSLHTKDTMVNDSSRYNAQNTFDELLNLGTIPIVNENDTVSTSEIPYVDSFGDNDRLSAIVAALIGGRPAHPAV